ncbi:MAG: DUF547 domain-containing protein [Calditrichaeota bacterium]|nr:DUF547 domain-containing protein [Calditrichota bacterium]
MQRFFYCITLLCILFSQKFDFSRYDHLLKQVVNTEGLVNYTALQSKYKPELAKLVQQFAHVSPDNNPELFKTEPEQLAYWINAYNLSILKLIAHEYPVKSIKDIYAVLGIAGELVWTKSIHTLGGKDYSFNEIEHDIIRKRFNEPRIHFAINCASMGCPLMQNYAFLPDKLDGQFNEAMSDFFKSDRHFKIDNHNKTLYLTKIFEWFSEDFYNEDNGETIYKFLIANAPDRSLAKKLNSIKAGYRIEYLDYSWDLNSQ